MPDALDVLFPLPIPPLRYLAPFAPRDARRGGSGAGAPGVGWRVVVPWQGSVRAGLVVAETEVGAARALELRDAVAWLGDAPLLAPALAAGLPRLADDLAAPAGVVLATFAATGFNDPLRHEVRAVDGTSGGTDGGGAPGGIEGLAGLDGAWRDAERFPADALELARRQGLIDERVAAAPDTVRVLRFARPADADLDGARRAAQRAALTALEARDRVASAAELARLADVPAGAARALVAKGYAEYADLPRPAPDPVAAGAPRAGEDARPAPAADPLPPAGPAPLALHGGRRRDRLRALLGRLRAALRTGRTPLVLVPEGSLLDESAHALAAALPGTPVRSVSGDLDDAERRALWLELQRGEPAVLVGTYLALFAPRPAPGPLVILEAGASAYKLPAGARAFVPDVALWCAARLGTEAITADALLGPETLLRAPPEARAALPSPRLRLHVADLTEGAGWPLGADLVRVLRQVEARDRQAVLLAPRRGFSAALGCGDCGWVAPCPNCDLPLRYHREGVPLRCHQCGYRTQPPELCPSCGGGAVAAQRGAGTEWIAQAVRRALPGFAVARYDGDRRDDLGALQGGEPGVVVGTTALLRAPPLPNVSLVAVSLLDGFLNLGDFRAEEEALRLLLQLPELWRGDARPPLVVLQTFRPDAPILEALRSDDPVAASVAFVSGMLHRRERFGYPPAVELARVQVTARERAAAERAAERLAARLRTAGADADELLGPAPAAVARLRGRYAYQLLIRSARPERFRELVGEVDREAGAKVRVDVAPREVGGLLE